MAVRLQIRQDAPAEIERFLVTSLDIDPADVFRSPSMLDLTGMFQICNLPGYPHLRDPQFVPQPVPEFTQAASLLFSWASSTEATSRSRSGAPVR